jgi:hypothetical protein
MVAASIAFYGLLAIFPAIAAMISIWGLLFDPQQIESVSGALPQDAAGIVNDQAHAVAGGAGTGVSLAAVVGRRRTGQRLRRTNHPGQGRGQGTAIEADTLRTCVRPITRHPRAGTKAAVCRYPLDEMAGDLRRGAQPEIPRKSRRAEYLLHHRRESSWSWQSCRFSGSADVGPFVTLKCRD